MFQINLRLILVCGKTKEFLFSPSDSAGDIAHHVFENWPEGKTTNPLLNPTLTFEEVFFRPRRWYTNFHEDLVPLERAECQFPICNIKYKLDKSLESK